MGINDPDFIGGQDAVHLARFLFEMIAIEETLGSMISAYFAPKEQAQFRDEVLRLISADQMCKIVRKFAKAGAYGERSERVRQVLRTWDEKLRPVRNAIVHTSPHQIWEFDPAGGVADVQHLFGAGQSDPEKKHTFADLGQLADQAYLIRMVLTAE